MMIDYWHKVAVVNRNNFVHKSLSSWSFNIAVGCLHKCRFCYVPDVSTIKLGAQLADYGVRDPDAEWGDYAMLRRWDANAFRNSVRKAMEIPKEKLNADGNRAVMLCTTTDAYQTSKDPTWNRDRKLMVRDALGILLNESDLNVRILTRSPLAEQDFDLYKQFGNRLLFGMSLPTLDNELARIYEPNAPAPSRRLETLQAAKAAGIPLFVAMAPTYPECGTKDLAKTLMAIRALCPVTIFHEPINIRAENVKRIEEHATSIGMKMNTEVFSSREAWLTYSAQQLREVEGLADAWELDQLHLWPDADMGTKKNLEFLKTLPYIPEPEAWLNKWWNRISEWPRN